MVTALIAPSPKPNDRKFVVVGFHENIRNRVRVFAQILHASHSLDNPGVQGKERTLLAI
jgi:hypothetical protein